MGVLTFAVFELPCRPTCLMYDNLIVDFATVCNQSTDFHFPELSEQLTAVESSLTKHHDWRSDNTLPGSAVLHAECSSIKSSGSSESEVRFISGVDSSLNNAGNMFISSACFIEFRRNLLAYTWAAFT